MRSYKPLVSLFLALLLTFPVRAAEGVRPSARHAVLIDADSLEVLYEKEAHTPAPMASTTKIMTAAVVLSSLSVDTQVSVPPEAVGVEGTSAYLAAGERLRVLDLLYALLLGSANDAAVALAIATDGSVSAFVAHMNEAARALGLTKTSFQNPHGLPDEGHETTAYELALIAAYAMRMPLFAEIVGTKSYHFRSSLREHTFHNHNRLLSYSDEAIGVKTGYTKASGRCLVGAARRDGTTLISVTLCAPDDWRDHRALWDYGFDLLAIPTPKTKTIS